MSKHELETIKSKLREISLNRCAHDDPDFNAYDYSGGNFDDAYELGLKDGRVIFAKSILAVLDGLSNVSDL